MGELLVELLSDLLVVTRVHVSVLPRPLPYHSHSRHCRILQGY